MSKENDVMTIYTFTKPDTVTISAEKYQELIRKSFGYDALVRVITQGMKLTAGGEPGMSYASESAVIHAVSMLDPEKYDRRLKHLRGDADA